MCGSLTELLNHRLNADADHVSTCNESAMNTAIQSGLSRYSSGHTTGIVMNSGDDVSQIVHLVIFRLQLAGRDLADYPVKVSLGQVFFHHDPDFVLFDGVTRTTSLKKMLPVGCLAASLW